MAAQAKADALAVVVAQNAAAELAAQKAANALADVLAQRAEISTKLATSLKPEERAASEKALAAVETKIDVAQEVVAKTLSQAEILSNSQEKLEASVLTASAQVQLATQAKKVSDAKSAAAEKASAEALVAAVAATAAKATANTVIAPKASAPAIAANGVRSDALINIKGLKPGQKIRVSVQVNIK